LECGEVVEDDGDGWEIILFELLCVGAVEDIFSDDEDCDSGDTDVLLCAGLRVRSGIQSMIVAAEKA
jgi:hypothetical protein